jgi:hypothetical protein
VRPKTCKILVVNMQRVDKAWKSGADRRTVLAFELALTPSVRSISNRGISLLTLCVKRHNAKFAIEYVMTAQKGCRGIVPFFI